MHFDLDSGQIEHEDLARDEPPAPASAAFMGDILERNPSIANPPSAPTLKANTTGFPAHKKRAARISAFKQQRAEKYEASFTSLQSEAPKLALGDSIDQNERRQIDEENRQRIAEMSPEEIEQERNELLSALSPSLIQRLLGRSNIDDGSNERDWNLDARPPSPPTNEADNQPSPESSSNKSVSFETRDTLPAQGEPASFTASDVESTLNSDLNTSPQSDQLPNSIHFPQPPQPPDLDPNSDSFLEDLHQKYFPNLKYDPSSLSWMTPIDPTDTTSPYHPSQTALDAFELRFNFKGALLPPRKAREIPVTEGLHHHANAPEAAGYTIPELAILARSAVAPQRCIAYQTLGRILYRLGKGEFGEEKMRRGVDGPARVAIDPNLSDKNEIADEEEAGSAMATGLWNCIEEGKVIDTLTEEASKERGHLTARTYAQEALWNWRRGGGRKRKAV